MRLISFENDLDSFGSPCGMTTSFPISGTAGPVGILAKGEWQSKRTRG